MKRGIDFKDEKEKKGDKLFEGRGEECTEKWRMYERIKREMMNEGERDERVKGKGENERKVEE